MSAFIYKGFDHAGKVRRGMVDAAGRKEARERLAADGIMVESLAQTGVRLRVTGEIRAIVYRELAALLGAGLPLENALEALIESPETRDARHVLAGVRDRVREGMPLADALAEVSSSVTPFERAVLQAAEHSATVESALEDMADFIEGREEMRRSIRAALLYPAIVVGAGVCVAVVMLGILIPRTRRLLGAAGELPGLTLFVMGLGHVLAIWVPLIIIVLMIGTWLLRARLRKNAKLRIHWDRMLFRLPLLGRGYTLLVNERFARTFAALIRGGVGLIDGLEMSAMATGSAWVRACAEREAENVRHGDRLSDAVRRIPPLSEFLPGLIRVGEAGGGLARLLSMAAERSASRWNRFMKTTLSLLEPLLIFIIGAFVLLVTLAVLLPVLRISRGL